MGRRGPNNHVSEKVIIREEPQKTCVDLKCHRTVQSDNSLRHRKYITAAQFDATGNPRLFDLGFVRFGQGWARDAIEADRKNTGTVRSGAFLPGLPAVTAGVEVISIVSFPDIP